MKKSIMLALLGFAICVNGFGNDTDYQIRIKKIQLSTDDAIESDDPKETYTYDMITKSYRFRNLFDGRQETAFVVKQRVYLSIDFMLEQPVPVDMIRIFNGYGKSDDLYLKNLRFRTINISCANINEYGNETNLYVVTPNSSIHLADNFGYTNLSITNDEPYKFFSFYFTDFYTNGVKYKDMCISEIQLWYRGKRYEIVNLDEVEKVMRYGSPATQNHWIGDPIKYKEKPKQKWWEFWKD